ncbi:hypothetical protein [Paraburkholderia diazotrophica]|uniref:Uncharacterized protein n=1 Tax=Paraburkholderia diazotrophica TaxID=667676 RepID=A0A1H6SCJ2_9BURK|nr:hypothetical protein [Paraburkholderia diazotrophica]SEI61132.1 hypothetical protein SAMN05192539_10034 [Paraburkholderia diazotrophica]
MKYIVRFFILVAALGLSSVASHARSLEAARNHSFDHVEIAYAHDMCFFPYSPVSFCDGRHISEIKNAIASGVGNFNNHYILLEIKEWKPSEYYGNSLMAIDTLTGIAYPLPFDYFSDHINMNNYQVIKNRDWFFP